LLRTARNSAGIAEVTWHPRPESESPFPGRAAVSPLASKPECTAPLSGGIYCGPLRMTANCRLSPPRRDPRAWFRYSEPPVPWQADLKPPPAKGTHGTTTRIPLNRGPGRGRGSVPVPGTSGQIGDGDGDRDRGVRALTCATRDQPCSSRGRLAALKRSRHGSLVPRVSRHDFGALIHSSRIPHSTRLVDTARRWPHMQGSFSYRHFFRWRAAGVVNLTTGHFQFQLERKLTRKVI
jgi:hypothetical protein